MKGIVFNVLNEMVDEKFGLEMWDKLLDKVQPDSEGIYTGVGSYEDSELVALVVGLSELTGIEVPVLIKEFGKYTLYKFKEFYPKFFEQDDLRSFLQVLDGVIHVEVRKLYQEAYTPQIEYSEPDENTVKLVYKSKRKMCHLAEGLIESSGDVFNEKIEVEQTQCMHDGAENCHIMIHFK